MLSVLLEHARVKTCPPLTHVVKMMGQQQTSATDTLYVCDIEYMQNGLAYAK